MAAEDWGPGQRQDAAGRGYADVRAEFAGKELSRHLALFYDSPDVQLEVAAAFVAVGLARDRRCLYLAHANDASEVRAALRAAGLDVAARLDAGDLTIRDAEEIYLEGGFDPERLIQTLAEACRESVEAGYEGLSVAGENTWCFHTEGSFDHVLEFEAEFDAACPDLPVVALCQYGLDRFSERSVAKALWTHRQFVYRHTVCENPYYVPPREYRRSVDPQLNARLMLEQAYDLARNRRQMERREQRLAVVNRVLRHNIRNELNTILGNLSLLAESTGLDAQERERLAVSREYARQVVETAEKARHVQQTLSNSAVTATVLGPVVEAAVDRVAEAHPEARITVTGPVSATVLADANLDTALVELLRNGIVHQDEERPSVTLAVETTEETVTVDVSNPGGPVPDREQRALLKGEETALDHASGLGLWLVKWIAENSYGTLRFPEAEPGQCRIRLELPNVDQ